MVAPISKVGPARSQGPLPDQVPAGGDRKRRSGRIARVPYRARVSAARACRPACPFLFCSVVVCASLVPREGDPCHTRAQCLTTIRATVHHSLTRRSPPWHLLLPSWFFPSSPSPPILLLCRLLCSSRCRLSTLRSASCGSSRRPERVPGVYVMLRQVAPISSETRVMISGFL